MNLKKTIISKWTKVDDEPVEEVLEEEIVDDEPVIIEAIDVIEPIDVEEVIVVEEVELLADDGPLDPDKEELRQMLEYIQKKQRGEDVSEYDFDEAYIIEKLKERND